MAKLKNRSHWENSILLRSSRVLQRFGEGGAFLLKEEAKLRKATRFNR